MSLPTDKLSLSQLQTEFGGVDPTSLSEYYKGGSYVSNNVSGPIPSSGAISLSVFMGKSQYVPPSYPSYGTYLYSGCSGYSAVSYYANGSGGSYMVVDQYNSPSCGYVPSYPAAGTELSTYCSGTTLMKNVANGSGGSTAQVKENNSPSCGYVPPPTYPAAGTNLGTYCSGYNLYTKYADGSGGYTSSLTQSNSPSCGYVPPPLTAQGYGDYDSGPPPGTTSGFDVYGNASVSASGGSGGYTYSWSVASGTGTLTSTTGSSVQVKQRIPRFGGSFTTMLNCTVRDSSGASVTVTDIELDFEYGNI